MLVAPFLVRDKRLQMRANGKVVAVWRDFWPVPVSHFCLVPQWRSFPMDDIDRQLMSLLRDNARSPVAALAKALKVSRGTVMNRMRKLEADGVIVGYTVRLKPLAVPHEIRALMCIEIEGNQGVAVLRALRGEPRVHALHTTNGRWGAIAEIRADTLESFDRLLDRVRQIQGIASTETSLLLSTYKA